MKDLRPTVPPFGESFRTAAQEFRSADRKSDISRAAPERAIRSEAPPAKPASVELVKAATVRMAAVRWLWPGYLAQGKMHILGGAPGCGKTTICLALIAIVTRGDRFPDGARCGAAGNAIMWSGEDDPADTLTPRLAAAGADLRRVFFVGPVSEGDAKRPFDPARDTAALRKAIESIGGAAILMVDPIVSAVVGDSHKNAEVRRALQPLADLAMESGAALLGVSHFSKGTAGRDPTERITGSLAFGALARVVMIAAKVEPKGDEPAKRIFARSKSNIGPDGGGFEYDLEQVEVPGHAGMFASIVRWGAPIEGTAREILAEAETLADGDGGSQGAAERFLREFLADGPKTVREVRTACEAHGITWRTAERAKSALGVEAVKAGFGSGWKWQIDRRPPTNAEDRQQNSLAAFDEFGGLRADDGGVDL